MKNIGYLCHIHIWQVNPIRIWQVSLQLSCSDTCQMRMGFTGYESSVWNWVKKVVGPDGFNLEP